jgi:PadR family transcriptional regulator, regulatory protein PadR
VATLAARAPSDGSLSRRLTDSHFNCIYGPMHREIREPTFLALTALAGEPLHGYAIIQEVARLSQGRTSLKAGTLYSLLDRLAGEGLIEVADEEVVAGRLRRTYRLTPPGTEVLREESRRRVSVSKVALHRLRVQGA